MEQGYRDSFQTIKGGVHITTNSVSSIFFSTIRD